MSVNVSASMSACKKKDLKLNDFDMTSTTLEIQNFCCPECKSQELAADETLSLMDHVQWDCVACGFSAAAGAFEMIEQAGDMSPVNDEYTLDDLPF